MSNETNAANALIVLTTGGGVIATVNEHATIISISIAFTGLLIGLFFHVMTMLHRRKVEKKSDSEYIENLTLKIREEERAKMIDEMQDIKENVNQAMSEKTDT